MNHRVRFKIYARHSTDRQNPRSADDQIDSILRDVTRRFPTWLPVEPYYKDEAVSGTSTVGRDAFLRMIDAADRRLFDVVLVEEVSRFARNRADAGKYRGKLADRDVRVLAKSDGYVDPESESGIWLSGIKELKAEADVRETARRVRRGLRAQAERGFITGPPPFGFKRKPIFDKSRLDPDGRPVRIGVKLKPDPKAAPIVVRIFELYREGLGFGSVAARLNEEGVPSARGGTWDQTAVRAIILNESYIGHIVAMKVERKRKSSGGRRVRQVPPSRQARCENAHPPIVSRKLWDEVHAILSRRSGKAAAGGPAAARPHHYLLSGLVTCGNCSGSFVVETSGGRQNPTRYYRCGIRRRRGNAVCDNALGVRLERLDSVVTEIIETKIITPDRIERILDRAREKVIESGATDRTSGIEAQQADVEAEIRNLTNALAQASGSVPSLLARLEKAERRKANLAIRVVELRSLLRPEEVTRSKLMRALGTVLSDFRSGKLLARQREILRRCFDSLRLLPDGMLETVTNPLGTLERVGVATTDGAGSGT